MKANILSTIHSARHSLGRMTCAGAVLLVASGAQAQNLYEADYASGNIYEFTPGGAQSTFATGLADPVALAFQGVTLPVPEPSTMGLLAIGATALLALRHYRAEQ